MAKPKQPRPIRVVEKKLGRNKAIGMATLSGIWIDPRQSPREYIDTLVHESMHLAFPHFDEELITVSSSFIATILWQQGYRKCKL